MNLYVDSHLEGIAELGGIDGLTCGCAAESEGGVFGVGEVAGSEVDIHTAEIGSGMGTKNGIELLREGVGIVPPYFALTPKSLPLQSTFIWIFSSGGWQTRNRPRATGSLYSIRW